MASGGRRLGAGRPKGKNCYGEATKPIRIPLSRIDEVQSLLQSPLRKLAAERKILGAIERSISSEKTQPRFMPLPLYSSHVQAGFPSPADDYIECNLDLNHHLIQHPAATFFVRATGDSMIQAGIQSGDMLIVDRSLEPAHGKIVIAAIDGELTVKRLSCKEGQVQLVAENPNYPPLDITAAQELVIWGVVTHVIHETK